MSSKIKDDVFAFKSLHFYTDKEINVDRTAKEETHEMIKTSFYFYKYFTAQISQYNKKLQSNGEFIHLLISL